MGGVHTGNPGGNRTRERSRSPHNIDWSRDKGRSDAALVDEMRSRDRDKAVASGKDYASKPLGVKQAFALPREQGAASHRLMEDETYVSDRFARKTATLPFVASAQEQQPKPSAEHQMRMQQIFEKYGVQKGV